MSTVSRELYFNLSCNFFYECHETPGIKQYEKYMTEFQIDSVEVDVGTAIVFTVWKILGKGKTTRLIMTEHHISKARRGYSKLLLSKATRWCLSWSHLRCA